MDNSLIKQFAEKKDKSKVQEFYSKALDIVTSALNDLNAKGGTVSKVLQEESTRIFPMGDYTNDTFIDQTGELEIVIASSNPQLIVANQMFSKAYLSARTKKQKAQVPNAGTFDAVVVGFLKCLLPYFNEETTLILVDEGIKIFCLEEYGFKILIRFATYGADDPNAILNFWEALSKKSVPVNLFLYNENIEKKDSQTKGNYKKLIRIFKNFRKNILMNKWATSSDVNKYFVELVCYNIPNSLIVGDDISMSFCKAVNYLDNCDIFKFISFDGNPIGSFYFAKINYEKIYNFTKFLLKASSYQN
jgi:hypothetical protein